MYIETASAMNTQLTLFAQTVPGETIKLRAVFILPHQAKRNHCEMDTWASTEKE